ncbi:MAG: hypothetical protein RLZZ08_1152 [Pseudomonadota bacterium]
MRKLALCAVAATALLAGCNQPAPAPELTVQQLMAKQVQPNAQIYWDAVQYINDETGNHDVLPQTDADWERVRQSAVTMGDHGKLLATPAYAEGRGKDWTEFANGLVQVAALAETAAKEKNPDKVFEVSGTIYNVCSACHQAYPPKEGPGAAKADANAAAKPAA